MKAKKPWRSERDIKTTKKMITIGSSRGILRWCYESLREKEGDKGYRGQHVSRCGVCWKMLSIMQAIIYKLCVQAGKRTAWACESDDGARKAERSWEMNVDAREVDSVCVTEKIRWRMEDRKWESCSSSCCGSKVTMLQMFGYIQNPFTLNTLFLKIWF